MSIGWIAQLIFAVSYFLAWVINEAAINAAYPHHLWITISAIAALVWSLALLFDNRSFLDRRPQA